MGINKKYRITISILICILLLLFFRLYTNQFSSLFTIKSINEVEINFNPDVNLQKLVKEENEEYEKVAYENRLRQYQKLYPDMYVETIKPIIYLEETKTAYLTFDDGPSKVTNKILDTLKEKDVKATFFIIGSNMNNDKTEYLQRMVEEGHILGIHTYSHDHKDIYHSVETYLEDFYKAYRLIYEATGVKATIFRFPWGSANNYNKKIKDELRSEMERRGFNFYDWNVSAEDSTGNPSTNTIKQNILKDVDKFNSPIILMHDSAINKNTAKVLPDILDVIIEKGYKFETLEKREPFHFKY